MAYQKPLVMVFQEYAKMSVATQSATLYPCIVGPCYHIIDLEDDYELAYVSEYTQVGISEADFPNNQPGALIQEDSIEFKFKNAIVQLNDTEESVDSITDNEVVFTELNYPTYAQVGDIVTITDTTSDPVVIGQDLIVIGVNSSTHTLILNRAIDTGTGTTFTADLYREVDEFTQAPDDTIITVDTDTDTFDITGLTVQIDGEDKLVDTADVYVGYMALRQDLSDIGTVYSPDEAKAKLGKLDTHDNPLGLGVSLTLGNTTVGVKYLGVDSDDSAGYIAALDKLDSYEDVYGIAPLTQDSAILGMFNTHTKQKSLPEVGQWRVCIGNMPLLTEKELQTGSGDTQTDSSSDLVILKDTDASFLANGVDSGHELRITGSDSEEYIYTVSSVISEDMLAVTEVFDGTALVSGDGPYEYIVVRELDKTAQANEVAGTSSSFGNSRFVHVWPDVVEVDGNQVPGYYLGCVVAGMIGGLPSHQGFTRISIGGIGRMYHSGDYFNQDQLDIIAGGGTFIFTQENIAAPPVCRHQLTTDMSTIEFRELSFVKNFDYTSILCKDVLDQFLGEYNIVPATLATLETAVRSVLKSLELYNLPKIGAPVLKHEIVSTQQLDDIRDRVEMYVNVWFPYALNTIGLHLVSQ